MKTTVSKSDFRDAFHRMNRGKQFTYDGLGALYDFIEEIDEDCDNETELDVIALCCEFVEYKSLEEFHKEYDKSNYPDLVTLRGHTLVIPINDDSFIIQGF